MTAYTVPNLVFEAEPHDAVVVVSPAAGNATLTRHELKHASLEVADGIRACLKTTSAGIDGQPVVAMALPNGLGFVLAFLGVVARGVVAAPLNPAYTVPEFEFYLSDSKAGVLVVDSAHANESFPGVVAARKLDIPVCSLTIKHDSTGLLRSSVNLLQNGEQTKDARSKNVEEDSALRTTASPTPETLALILHTSGTTGKPKAVPLSHANLVYSALNVASAYSLGPEDRGYLIQVLFHIHGIVASLLAPLVSGGSVVVPDKFDANVTWAEFANLHCSWLSGTPSALQILLHSPKAGPDLGIRFLRSCSSPLLPSTFKALQELFRCPVLEAYAMTENAHQMTTNKPGDAQPGSVGKPSGTVRLQIYGDDANEGPLPASSQGEVCIAGPSVTRGYLENPVANEKAFFTVADGTRWFRTGDVGIINDAGHLRIVGRKSEIINRGGEKISPPEVDEAIMLCAAPHIREAACFAVPDDFFGQEVEAAVVLAGDAPVELHDEAELKRLLGERLALFKIPKRIHFFEDKIPKGPTGKIQRVQLARKLAKGPEAQPNGTSSTSDASHLRETITRFIADDLRVDAAAVQPEVTLLELGADSMSLTRLLGDLHHLGCAIAMSNVMLNPTVQQVIDMCIKSHKPAAHGKTTKDNGAEADLVEEPAPAPFTLLREALEGEEGAASIDVVLTDVATQTGLQADQVEDILPLSPEAKWFMDMTLTDKFGLLDTQVSFATLATEIQPSVDIDRFKRALDEASQVEPLPRTYMVRVFNQWFQAIARPGVAPLNWHQWSAPSKQAALDRLQEEHLALRYRPGIRASKYVLAEYPDEEGQTGRLFAFVDSHAVTDNQARAMLRDNVVKLYLGEATIDDLPQQPLSTAVFVRETHRLNRENRARKEKFWAADEQSHAVSRRPAFIPPPELGIKGQMTQFAVNAEPYYAVWTGDLKGLTVAMGMTAPTLVQAVLPLALAAYEYQGTRVLPTANCFGYATGSVRASQVPNIHQARGFGLMFAPFRSLLAVAGQSLWLHVQQAALKLSDLNAHRLLVESAAVAGDMHVQFAWRELAAGSRWAEVVEAGPELASAEFCWYTSIMCVRLGVDSLMIGDGETAPYIQWRSANGFPVRLVDVLQRCLTFLCQRKDDLVSLTIDDLVTAVWADEVK